MTKEEVSQFILEIDVEDEFDDVELDEATMAAVSGGGLEDVMDAAKEEAHDEPWGRCPVMRQFVSGYEEKGFTFSAEEVKLCQNNE